MREEHFSIKLQMGIKKSHTLDIVTDAQMHTVVLINSNTPGRICKMCTILKQTRAISQNTCILFLMGFKTIRHHRRAQSLN